MSNNNGDGYGIIDTDPFETIPAPLPQRRLNWSRIWKKYESQNEHDVSDFSPRRRVERLVEEELGELKEQQ